MQAEKIFSGFLHIGSPSFVLVHIGLAQFYYIVGWNAKGIGSMYQQFPASPPPQPSPPPRHPLCQLVESLYEFVRVNVRKVDGNGSPLKNAVFGIYANEQDAKNEEEEIFILLYCKLSSTNSPEKTVLPNKSKT